MDSRGLHHHSSLPTPRALGLELELELTPLPGSAWVLQEEPLFFVLAQQVRPVGPKLEELVRLMQRMRSHRFSRPHSPTHREARSNAGGRRFR